jgi:carbon-monoxide dehydrogenase medium subunit
VRLDTPTTISQALASLSEPGARCLAGGQSLGVMLNARLVEPAVLVSLRGIDQLRAIDVLPDGSLRIGAMTSYAAAARLPVTSGSTELIVDAIPLIAHPPIRNQGTFGGSICHADPAGDLPTVAACVGARIRIAHERGIREVPAAEFFHGYFETAVQPGELVISIDVPRTPDGVRARYEKFMLTEGDFAVVSVAALVGWDGTSCNFARMAVGACAAAPVRCAAADALLVGSALDDETLRRATEILLEACDPPDDFRGSRDYRMKLIPRLLRRAALAAKDRAGPTEHSHA